MDYVDCTLFINLQNNATSSQTSQRLFIPISWLTVTDLFHHQVFLWMVHTGKYDSEIQLDSPMLARWNSSPTASLMGLLLTWISPISLIPLNCGNRQRTPTSKPVSKNLEKLVRSRSSLEASDCEMPFAFQAKHPWDYSCHQFGLITWFINWRADASCRSRSAVQAVLIPSGPPSVSIRDAHRMSILGPWQIFDNCMYLVTMLGLC